MHGRHRTIVIGRGLAGAKAAEALQGRLRGGERPVPRRTPYIRPPLSKDYPRGQAGPDAVHVHPEAWYGDSA
jgi:3-phenylpropionate/trans-cinnamate dioxygenase ferredoxin reductase subunit